MKNQIKIVVNVCRKAAHEEEPKRFSVGLFDVVSWNYTCLGVFGIYSDDFAEGAKIVSSLRKMGWSVAFEHNHREVLVESGDDLDEPVRAWLRDRLEQVMSGAIVA